MKLLLNSVLLLAKIILPPVICLIIIYFFKVYIDLQYILTFSLVIVIFNKEKIKHDFILSFLYSILLSFLVLILSMAAGNIIYIIKDELFINLIPNNILKRLHVIPKSIVSPLLMFYSYQLLFKIEKTNYFKVVKWSSVFVLVVLGLTKLFFKNEYLFMYWQFIMALALQLILYKKELEKLFITKKIV